jgi:hypothetical protein
MFDWERMFTWSIWETKLQRELKSWIKTRDTLCGLSLFSVRYIAEKAVVCEA